jgi:DNA repair protein RecO (recombination protein O)
MRNKSFSCEGIVLKRVNTGEVDRVVTLLTPLHGKLTCVAKGVRKMSSSQRASLEPGNHISAFFIETQSWPILTQTKLFHEFQGTKKDLMGMKRLSAVLEIVDRLFPENVEEPELFQEVLTILKTLHQSTAQFASIQERLKKIVQDLGYQSLEDTPYKSITEYVAVLADRPMKSYDFLTVKEV